jgi:hypothetical protein
VKDLRGAEPAVGRTLGRVLVRCCGVNPSYNFLSERSFMGTLWQSVLTGGIVYDGNVYRDNRTYSQVVQRSESKTASWQRVRPVGVNLLFNGTDVYSSRDERTNGTYYRLHMHPDGRSWSSETVLVGAPSIGPSPYGTNIPDAMWANRLRINIRDTDINLAQAFAERKQVERMFSDYGGRLLKAYSSLRKGNVNGVFNALLGAGKRPYKGWKRTIHDATGVASESWLAWQYGVRPLISDLAGAVKEYDKVRRIRPLIRSYTVSGSNDARAGGVVAVNNPPTNYTTTKSQEFSVRAYAEFQDSAQAWDQSAQRLGLTDPLLLAWEVIPYSFVIDWFVGVGDYLEASGTFAGLRRVGIHVTTTTVEDSVGVLWGGKSRRKVVIKSRVFKNTLPSATVRVKANPFTVSHVTSALALIRQLRK